MAKYEWLHIDTCLSDFWAGHHLPHIQIPVWPGMSLRQIKQSMRDELRQGAVMGSDDDARLLSSDMIEPEKEKRADFITRKAYAAINRIKPAKKGQRTFFNDIEFSENDDITVYAFFVLVKMD